MNRLTKIILISLGILILGGTILFWLLWTSPESRPEPKIESGKVKVIGKLEPIERDTSLGLAGSKELCRRTPECEEKLRQKKTREGSGWTEEELKNFNQEDWDCFNQCLPPKDYPEMEEITVELTSDQIGEVVKTYKPSSVRLSDVRLEFRDGIIYGSAVGGYPPFGGLVSVEAEPRENGFKLKKVYLGQISLPDNLVRQADDGLESLMIDTLADFGVSIAAMRLENDKLILNATAPKGLVRTENGVLIIDAEKLRQIPRPGQGPDFEIQ